MSKSTWILLGILGAMVAFWLIGNRDQATRSASIPAPPTAAAATWHQLGEWSGTGTKQTEGFAPTSREVRISWDSKSNLFQIFVHRASDDFPVEVAANTQEQGTGSTLVRLRGEHYLKINSVGKWAVKVEDKR
jgi:hypothetical protein